MKDDNIRPPYVVAEMWWCGDEICDCVQPQVTLILPHDPPHPPWIQRRALWQGSFYSRSDPSESETQKQELRDACKRFNIELDEKTWTGMRPATEEEVRA